MGHINLGCFKFSKLLFSRTLFSKIKNNDLKTSKYLKLFYLIRFQYEELNESDKSKFRDNLIYFLS
jgi:hypothetical protein